MQFQNILERALPPDYTVTPGDLCDLCDMYFAILHLKKVTNDWWMEHQVSASKLIRLAAQVAAEARLVKLELPDDKAKVIQNAMDLSVSEIRALRAKLLEDVVLLKQIPLPGTTLH